MKKKNPFKIIFILLFLLYTALFIARKTGYYENKQYEKTILTQKQMLKFEEDVAKGLPVDIIDYLPEKKDYSNVVTKSANAVESLLSNILEGKIKNVWGFVKSLFIG